MKKIICITFLFLAACLLYFNYNKSIKIKNMKIYDELSLLSSSHTDSMNTFIFNFNRYDSIYYFCEVFTENQIKMYFPDLYKDYKIPFPEFHYLRGLSDYNYKIMFVLFNGNKHSYLYLDNNYHNIHLHFDTKCGFRKFFKGDRYTVIIKDASTGKNKIHEAFFTLENTKNHFNECLDK